jgi:sugar phosphate isomerase/epimerase
MYLNQGIKLGVTLYSFQDEYVWGKLTLEGCLEELGKMGTQGVEILGDQMIHNSPFPEEGFYEKWHGWLMKYDLKPVCNDIFINTTLYKNRILTTKESVSALKAEIVHANKMGMNIVRLVSKTPNEIIMPCLDFAEKYNVQMALEIHAGGSSISTPNSQEFIEIMTKINSPYIGLVFDMGLFCRKFPRVILSYYRREGTASDLLDYVDRVFKGGDDMRSISEDEEEKVLQKYGKNPIDREFIKYSHAFENNPLDILKPYIGNVKNIHGKFYEMTDENVDYSIPYDEIIAFLNTNRYNGFICSEYEGNRFVPSGTEVHGVEQVTSHQKMMRRYLQG